MESQAIRGSLSNVRLEPTMLESEARVAMDEAIPAFGTDPSQPERRGPERALAERYLLRGRISEGHLGEVYEAIDLQLSAAGRKDHCVALELVTLSGSQADVRQHLASEFKDLLSISHPNIARIVDFGVDGTTTFFTAELLEGVSLRSIVDSNPTDSSTESELLAVIRGLADGLSYLHGKGFVHGDLTPESVFVTTDYEVKIADLASARLARTRQGSTEMRFGGSVPLDVQDDVFGLACVVYEWLTNEHPFDNVSSFEAFRMELKPRRIKGLPGYRWKALSRALALQAEARTPTVAQFAAEFGIAGTETLAEAESKDAARPRAWPRSVLWAGGIAGLIAVVVPNYEDLRELLVTLQTELQDRAGQLSAQPGEAESFPLLPAEPPAPTEAEEPASANLYPYPAEPAESPPPSEMPATGDAALDEASLAVAPSESNVAPAPVPGSVVAPGEPAIVPEQALPSQPIGPAEVPADATPLSFRFAQDTVTVSEADSMVAVLVERAGGLGGEASMIWWTGEGTAIASNDYADLGVRTETFSTDQVTLTVYVPLVSDSLAEQPESFNVYLSWESAPADFAETLEVIVVDDDA